VEAEELRGRWLEDAGTRLSGSQIRLMRLVQTIIKREDAIKEGFDERGSGCPSGRAESVVKWSGPYQMSDSRHRLK
jgi:hypothetical protein